MWQDMAFHTVDVTDRPSPLLLHGAVGFEHDPAKSSRSIERLIVLVPLPRPRLTPAVSRLWAGIVGIFLHKLPERSLAKTPVLPVDAIIDHPSALDEGEK